MQLSSDYALPFWYFFNLYFNFEIVENSVENVKNFDNTRFLMVYLCIFCKVFIFTEQMSNKKQCIYNCIYTVSFERKIANLFNLCEVPLLVAF